MKYDAMIKEQLQGVYDYLVETRDVWDKVYNFKLRNAYYYAEDIVKEYRLLDADKWDDYFYAFCNEAYDNYKEDVRQGVIDEDVVKRIGRTSGFYLTDIHDRDMIRVMYNVIEESTCGFCPFTIFLNDGNVTFACDYELDDLEEKWYAENLLNEVKEFLAPAIEYADYLNEFKNNQVEEFRYYLDDLEGMAEWEEEEQQEIEANTMACYI